MLVTYVVILIFAETFRTGTGLFVDEDASAGNSSAFDTCCSLFGENGFEGRHTILGESISLCAGLLHLGLFVVGICSTCIWDRVSCFGVRARLSA